MCIRDRLKPGAAELLSYLKAQGRTLVLASTTSRANVEKYMQWNENIKSKANFGTLFSRIYTRDDVTELKPSPQVHELILSALGASPDDCLVVDVYKRQLLHLPECPQFLHLPFTAYLMKSERTLTLFC